MPSQGTGEKSDVDLATLHGGPTNNIMPPKKGEVATKADPGRKATLEPLVPMNVAAILIALSLLFPPPSRALALSSPPSTASGGSSQQLLGRGGGRQPLNSQQRRQESLRVGHHPLLSLNLNLDALARAQAPERAQELYQRISALWKEGYYAVAPDVVSFNSVLKAWQSDPERALRFWEQEVEELQEEDEEPAAVEQSRGPPVRRNPLEPNVRSYNTFLLALARAGMSRPAELLLRQMQDAHSLVQPDRITYNTVLLALCASDDRHAPERASELLQELIESDHLKPDVVSFNTVLTAWSNVGTANAALRAEDLLDSMPQHRVIPDVQSYSTVIQAWARCGNSHRALELLRRMTTHAQPPLVPNQVTYTAVLQALCRDRRPQDAHTLLQHLVQRALAVENDDPSSPSPGYTPVIQPDAVMFSAMIQGWADHIRPSSTPPQHAKQAAQAVLELLRQMKDLSASWPSVAPNEQTYAGVLSALARSRHFMSGPQCESVLREMVGDDDDHRHHNDSGLQPTILHWNAVLNAYAKSPRPNKLREAQRVWANLLAAKLSPDTVSYNTLLAAAANSFRKDEASRKEYVDVGFEVFRRLRQDPTCDVTSLSFHYLFKVIRKFIPHGADRDKLLREIFDLCCEHGCLSDSILYQLESQTGLSDEEAVRFFGDNWHRNLTLASLPSSWSRNAMNRRPRLS